MEQIVRYPRVVLVILIQVVVVQFRRIIKHVEDQAEVVVARNMHRIHLIRKQDVEVVVVNVAPAVIVPHIILAVAVVAVTLRHVHDHEVDRHDLDHVLDRTIRVGIGNVDPVLDVTHLRVMVLKDETGFR